MNKKIQCPEWLKDPAKYDIAKDFKLSDWYDQISARQAINVNINRGTCTYSFNEYLLNTSKLNSAASIRMFFELSQKKIEMYGNNEFKEYGLIYDSIWSQTIQNIKLKNKMSELTQKDVEFIDDGYPNEICERFRPKYYHPHFSGISTINVDLFAPDDQLKEEFNEWLKHARNFFEFDKFKKRNDTVTDSKLQQWAKHRVLAYWDLMLWIKKHSYKYGGKNANITKQNAAEWLFKGIDIIDDTTRFLSNCNKYYKIISNPLVHETIGRRMFTQRIKPNNKTLNNNSKTLSCFLKSKGYVKNKS